MRLETVRFPEEAAPIFSLTVSPHFAQDQTLYVGTEEHGLYQSIELGQSWQKVALPAICINPLVSTPQERQIFAATNTGLYSSRDEERRWNCLLDLPDAFSLTVSDSLIIAGLVNQGAWLSTDRINWQRFFTLPVRALTGMVLSPRFDSDAVGFLYGSQEGVWQTSDGGHSWSCLNENLPTLGIRSLALAPRPHAVCRHGGCSFAE